MIDNKEKKNCEPLCGQKPETRCHLSIIERTKVVRILCAVANGTLNRFEVPTKFEDVVVDDGDLVSQGKLVLHCTQIKHY